MKKKNLFLARRLTGRYASLWVSVIAILLTIVTASILLLMMGKNPLTALASFLQGCGFLAKENYGGGSGQLTDLLDFLNYLTPLILASLAFITALKAGLFNIGISGQMLLAGFTATVLVGRRRPDRRSGRISEISVQYPRSRVNDHDQLYHQLSDRFLY